MNIIQEPWLPFRLSDGSIERLPMTHIARKDVIDFALPRDDFQGAAYQFAIGLLQSVLAPKNSRSWYEFYQKAPEIETLENAFAVVAHAFNTQGGGALFMQDREQLETPSLTTVAALLIEAPGTQSKKLNIDHFVKRGIGEVMSLEMAILSLFTLQINAPAGGSGHRVGLRGGGPLTTLILPQSESASLWHKLWLNVLNRQEFIYDDPDFTDGSVFPWLVPTKSSQLASAKIYADDVHPLHMFWAMPRRIRLVVEKQSAICQISGELAQQTVTHYRTQNYGNDYSGTWAHFLTPYRFNPKKENEEHSPVKGQQNGITYQLWDTLTFTGNNEKNGHICAKVVTHYQSLVNQYWASDFGMNQTERARLWVFGYDMDKMKPRGWYSLSMPLFSIKKEHQEKILFRIQSLQKILSLALWQCRTQVRASWFRRPKDVKNNSDFINFILCQRSEKSFFIAVQQIIQNASVDGAFLSEKQATTWLNALRKICITLFDEYALSEQFNEQSMKEIIQARRLLLGWLYGGKEIKSFMADHNIIHNKEVAP